MNTISNQSSEDSINDKYLLFCINGAHYGVPLKLTLEILMMQPITKLPKADESIKGIINLRGTMIPLIDMRAKLGLPEIPYGEKTSIIVLDINDTHIGVIVDSVSEVLSVSAGNIFSAPQNIGKSINHIVSISQIDEKIILNLDCEHFFMEDIDVALLSTKEGGN